MLVLALASGDSTWFGPWKLES